MKKVLAIVLALVLTLGMCAGCTPAEKELSIAQFVFNFSDPQQGLVKNACEKIYADAKVKATLYDAADSQGTQNDQIDTAIQKGATLLVVGLKDVSAAQNVVDKAKKAGVPIVFYNVEPDKAIINSYDKCWFVGTAPRGGGEMQGEMAANFINQDFAKWDRNGDGFISYIVIRADLSHPEANGRTAGAVEVADKVLKAAGHSGLKKIHADDNTLVGTNWSTAEGVDLMKTFLTANPISAKDGVEVVFANNDGLAIGVMQALNEKGWNEGGYDNKFLPIVGVDATPECKTYIDAKKMLGSAGQPADKMALYVTTVALNALKGNEALAGTDWTFVAGEKKLLMPYDPYPLDLASK